MAIDIKDTAQKSSMNRAGPRFSFFGVLLKFVGLLVLIVVSAAVAAYATGWRPPAIPPMSETVDRSSPAVLRSLEDLAEFNPSSGHFEVVVDLEEDTRWVPSWVSGERILFVGVGSVDSVISFEGLDQSRVDVSDNGESVTIRLPAPRLEEPQIDLDQSYLYARDRGVLNRVGGLFGEQSVDQPAYQKAVEQIREAAAADDQILALGEQNATSMLEGMLYALGFTSVDVVFEEDQT